MTRIKLHNTIYIIVNNNNTALVHTKKYLNFLALSNSHKNTLILNYLDENMSCTTLTFHID